MNICVCFINARLAPLFPLFSRPVDSEHHSKSDRFLMRRNDEHKRRKSRELNAITYRLKNLIRPHARTKFELDF